MAELENLTSLAIVGVILLFFFLVLLGSGDSFVLDIPSFADWELVIVIGLLLLLYAIVAGPSQSGSSSSGGGDMPKKKKTEVKEHKETKETVSGEGSLDYEKVTTQDTKETKREPIK